MIFQPLGLAYNGWANVACTPRWQSQQPFFTGLQTRIATSTAIVKVCDGDWGTLRETETLA